MDLSSFAVLRAMGRQTTLEVDTEALIDIGARVTNIVVHSAGVPRFVRILLMGGQDVTDAVAERLGVTLEHAEGLKQQYAHASHGDELVTVTQTVETIAQDFVDEIRGSLDYYGASNPGAPVERVLVSGGGSRLDGLVERLGATRRVPWWAATRSPRCASATPGWTSTRSSSSSRWRRCRWAWRWERSDDAPRHRTAPRPPARRPSTSSRQRRRRPGRTGRPCRGST